MIGTCSLDIYKINIFGSCNVYMILHVICFNVLCLFPNVFCVSCPVKNIISTSNLLRDNGFPSDTINMHSNVFAILTYDKSSPKLNPHLYGIYDPKSLHLFLLLFSFNADPSKFLSSSMHRNLVQHFNI